MSESPPRVGQRPLALSGAVFAIAFILSDIIAAPFKPVPLPMPDAPAAETVRYLTESQTGIVVHSSIHLISALALLIFTSVVVANLREVAPERRTLRTIAAIGGGLAGLLLIASAVLGIVSTLTISGLDQGQVASLRTAGFLTGGTFHVAMLGALSISTSLVALKTRAFPRWIAIVGIVSGVLAVLSLVSLGVYLATPLIPLGRFTNFFWAIAAAIMLTAGHSRMAVNSAEKS